MTSRRPGPAVVVGQVFGRWTVVALARKATHKSAARWLCRCSCGNEGKPHATSLAGGRSMSCGCLNAEMKRERKSRLAHGHGASGRRSPTYRSWCAMLDRCRYPSTNSYKDYGGRGITVCSRWSGPGGFEAFLADMGERPSAKHSIDREDPDGHYTPDNCRWSTTVEQRHNRRRSA